MIRLSYQYTWNHNGFAVSQFCAKSCARAHLLIMQHCEEYENSDSINDAVSGDGIPSNTLSFDYDLSRSASILYQSNLTFLPEKSPQTAITPNMLKTAEPTIVPMPKSLSVTNVPITLVKNSGELVPVKTWAFMWDWVNHNLSYLLP